MRSLMLMILVFFSGVVWSQPSAVTLAGSFQDELGCSGDWQVDCANTELTYDPQNDVWSGTFALPAGSYEYKAALNRSWDESYGLNGGSDNLTLTLAADQEVTFHYDPKTHHVFDSVNRIMATIPGSYQAAVGCGDNWKPECLHSWLQDGDGDGLYHLTLTGIPAGSYECKVAINRGWDENYGQNGEAGGANFAFSVGSSADEVLFTYDSVSHLLAIQLTAGETPAVEIHYAIIHYLRDQDDYGQSGDDAFWGLHLWGDAVDSAYQTTWQAPLPFKGEDRFGRFAWIKLADSGPVNFIIHQGDNKDTPDDRSFDPSQTPEIWVRQGDATHYASMAQALGYATIHYHREDGQYGEGTENYWGLHLWSENGANAIDPAAETDWAAPRPPDGVDEYGAFFRVPLNPNDSDAAKKPLKFILHQPGGDDTSPGGSREPGGDRSFIPAEMGAIYLVEQDETLYAQRGQAMGFAVIHYHREDGDYGDTSSANFGDYWGLHVWTGAAAETAWQAPLKPSHVDVFGPVFQVPLAEGATELNYILHRGDTKDPGPDQTLHLLTVGHEVWQLEQADLDAPYILPAPQVGGSNANPGNLSKQQAYWVSADTILWAQGNHSNDQYALYYSGSADLSTSDQGIMGGQSIPLTPSSAPLDATLANCFPHLRGLPVLTISAEDLALVPEILRSQMAVGAVDGDGLSRDATGVQIAGVLDDLFTYDGTLGVTWVDGLPQVSVWAPTAQLVTLLVFADADEATVAQEMTMTRSDFGVWQAQGDSSWEGQYYLFRVQVFAPSTQRIETNEVTDPYSLSLAVNSTRSQFINLQKESWKPEGWDGIEKSPLAAPEDISIYELHVRDFSIWDESVPESSRGTYAAFSATGSDGVTHLQALRHSGLTHIHLLPVFDIATINERKEERLEPDRATLASFAADSEEQQKLVTNLANQDGFNWGYDPFHYTVPEGSYAQNAEGGQRILEFRHMIQALSDMGFRVVMDVVYNHTNASGQNEKSVLDRIVPGYYHRLNADGGVEKSTCCENTASEHAMMEKLMVDSLLIWAKEYKIDAFRFDLMGHHMVSNMQHVRDALAALTPEQDGVDGSSIYLYGEGWNFGEVANNQRGVNATQLNLKGEGIGTFSDRLRDAVRGGGPFDDGAQLKRQGFANGLFYDPNDLEQGNQWDTLRSLSDQIRVGLAGNLADFTLTNGWDQMVTGAQVDYNGQPAGYTADPQEVITYISKHDNQTLYDINIYGAPLSTSMEDRVRLQMVGLSLVALGQGVPFFHAGSDFLRSKSLDRDSYNSGDWFNVLDFSMEDNNFGVGLPVEEKNGSNWSLMAPLLANPDLKPEPGDIQSAAWRFQELLAIRYSSPLFRMETAEDIHSRLSFHNTGSQQVPGLIAMGLTDRFERDLDPENDRIMVIFNANDEAQEIHLPEFVSASFVLHPILAESVDPVVRTASFNAGTFAVPARTTAVFLEPQGHFTLGQRYVAHIATSDAWQSRIILDNATSETACITMKLFGEGATLKHQEFRLNPQERREFMATEGDAASFTVDQDGLVVRSSFFSNVGAGLAEFICDGQTYETLHFTFPHYASDLMGWRGLALMNFAPMNQEISLRSYDASGGIIGETSWTMAAFERRVGLLNELFPDWNAAAIARITVQGTQELSGISLSGTEDVIRLLYAPAVGEPLAGTVFASHLASDLNAWQNLIILDNVSDEPLEATVTFIAGDQEMSQTLTIAANASVIQAVNAEPFLAEMAKVTCASNGLIARQAFLNLQAGGGGTAEFLLSQDAAHRLALNFPPLDGSDPHQIGLTWRGLAIGNLADVSVMATFHAMGAEGILHSVEATIPARHRWVGFLEDLFDGVDPQSVHRVVVEGDGLMGGLNISGQGSTRLLFTPAVPLP